jgi:hypothetical protein
LLSEFFFLFCFQHFPVAFPFIFIDDVQTALRVSNIIAILMMFFLWLGPGKNMQVVTVPYGSHNEYSLE